LPRQRILREIRLDAIDRTLKSTHPFFYFEPIAFHKSRIKVFP
jgi:hypothetical protein